MPLDFMVIKKVVGLFWFAFFFKQGEEVLIKIVSTEQEEKV